MGKQGDQQKRELKAQWRNIHTAIWLIGLAILAFKGWWWPGILVLVGISLILEAVLAMTVPEVFEDKKIEGARLADAPETSEPAPLASERRIERLPAVCPNCGGPIRGHEVKWTGIQSADCPFCGSNLPMKKEESDI